MFKLVGISSASGAWRGRWPKAWLPQLMQVLESDSEAENSGSFRGVNLVRTPLFTDQSSSIASRAKPLLELADPHTKPIRQTAKLSFNHSP